MTSVPPKVYWDACIWISLIMGEAQDGRAALCEHYIEEARKGNLEIWTSSISHAEVYKRKCDGEKKSLQEAQDRAFEDFIDQDFVKQAPLDHYIGVVARTLLRTHSVLKKPNDGIHLATAVWHNIDQMHTYDKDDLIPLNGKVKRRDGVGLVICEIPTPAGGVQQRVPLLTNSAELDLGSQEGQSS